MRLRVPTAVLPPTTEDGTIENPVSAAAWIVKVPLLLAPLRPAVIVEKIVDGTPTVRIEKLALAALAATVTLALAELDVSETVIPPAPAGPLKLTVPVEGLPPITVVGAIERPASEAAVTVRFADLLEPDSVAVTVAFVLALTAAVLTVNVAIDAPDGTVTEGGTVALKELEVRDTAAPPGPAAPLSETVPLEVLPP